MPKFDNPTAAARALKMTALAVILNEAGRDEAAHNAARRALLTAERVLAGGKANVLDMEEAREELILGFL